MTFPIAAKVLFFRERGVLTVKPVQISYCAPTMSDLKRWNCGWLIQREVPAGKGKRIYVVTLQRWKASQSVAIRRLRDTFAKVGDCRPVSQVEEMVVSSLLAGLVGVPRKRE